MNRLSWWQEDLQTHFLEAEAWWPAAHSCLHQCQVYECSSTKSKKLHHEWRRHEHENNRGSRPVRVPVRSNISRGKWETRALRSTSACLPPGPERPRGRAVRSDLAAHHCCRSPAPGAARPAAASQRVHYLLNSSWEGETMVSVEREGSAPMKPHPTAPTSQPGHSRAPSPDLPRDPPALCSHGTAGRHFLFKSHGTTTNLGGSTLTPFDF